VPSSGLKRDVSGFMLRQASKKVSNADGLSVKMGTLKEKMALK